jgi:uncharacterized protein
MRTYLARLGAFTFSLDTAAFQELQRVSTYRWEAKNRIGRKPAQQNVGSGADTIRLNGTIYPHYRGGLGQMASLRALASSGEPLPLIYAFDAVGQYCGRWCITEISETRTVFFENGAPRRIDFALSLVEYGEDAGAAIQGPVALMASAAVVSSADASGAASAASTLSSQAASVGSQAQALSMVGEAAAVAQDVAGTISTSINSVLNSDAVRLAVTSISELRALKAAARGLSGAVGGIEGIAENPGTALAALGNLSATAGTMSDLLSSASTKLGLRSGKFDGGGSLHRQQIASATGSMSTLSSAADSIRGAANSLKGFF